MRRIYLDFETTGLDPVACGLTQMAIIIEDDDREIKEMYNFNIKPFEGAEISKKALEVTNKSYDEIMTYPDERDVLIQFLAILDKHFDRTSRDDNWTICAYNGRFDVDFLSAWMERYAKNFFTYFNYHVVDPLALLRIMRFEEETNMNSLKLGLVYKEVFDETFDAHDAMADIIATRRLYLWLVENYLNFKRRA